MEILFIVGAQRSGTTYLYTMLDSHPQILMARPIRPEPKYFLRDSTYKRNSAYYESLYYESRRKEHLYIGEKSTSYIESNVAAERIKSMYPEAKILIMLRNPVTRTYSNYRFSVENGIETLSFFDAIMAEQERLENSDFNTSVNPYAYQRRGHYILYINQYLKYFSRDQLYIIIYEEFICNINSIQRLYKWLGVNQSHIPKSYKKKINSSQSSYNEDSDHSKTLGLLKDQFAQSNMLLEKYIERDISIWK